MIQMRSLRLIFSLAELAYMVTSACVGNYAQCGGAGYAGETTCCGGSNCYQKDAYYSQCRESCVLGSGWLCESQIGTPNPTLQPTENDANNYYYYSSSGNCVLTDSDFPGCLVVSEDMQAMNSEIEGNLAVCGDLELTNYGVAVSILSTTDTTLLVAGDFNISSNVQIHTGTASIGGALNHGSGANLAGGVLQPDTTASDQCSQQADTARSTASKLWDIQYPCSTLTLSGSQITIDSANKDPSIDDRIAVFCVPANRLKKASTIVIRNSNDDLIVVKVKDNSKSNGVAELRSKGFDYDDHEQALGKMIWVFEDTFTTIEMSSLSWPGTIVAPTAHLLGENSNIEGNAYVASFGGQDMNNARFLCRCPVIPSRLYDSCPTPAPSQAPTQAPTAQPQIPNCPQFIVTGYSQSGPVGASTLQFSVDGVDSAFDDSWMSRGFNVVSMSQASGSYEVLATATFDIYESSSQSSAMLQFLYELDDGTGVLIVVHDSAEYYLDPPHISSELVDYVASTFGASDFSSVGFRDSYIMAGFKGSAKPVAEILTTGDDAGTGLTATLPLDCPTYNTLELSLTTDTFASETTYTLVSSDDTSFASVTGPPFTLSSYTTYNITLSEELRDGFEYTFTIFDSFGDGICCSWGLGSYTLSLDNIVIVTSDGAFGASEISTIQL